MVARRVAGQPLETVLGWAEFRGLRIHVSAGVFVPRRRTSLLVSEALKVASSDAVIVDVCCGSGAVGAALLDALPAAAVYATDIDPVAVRCARRNVPVVLEGDLYSPLPASLRGDVSVIVANAPYVPTSAISLMPPEARDHEPRVALDGGADGLDVQRRVIREATSWLRPGGYLFVETSVAQAAGTLASFRAAGFSASVVRSVALEATVVSGRSAAGP